ncbi:MAG TPA: glycosyltransferase [Gammaproteobacteria bacterium]|jgi:rSAM/selenodomain-associated transferase 1|nr:glycosyltransferase [Gammaproteobacteria bacterium]
MAGTIDGNVHQPVLLQIFTKRPLPGRVKTRLQTVLTPKQAAEVHATLTRVCLDKFSGLPARFRVELWGDAPATTPFFAELLQAHPRLGFRLQKGKDLGQRMAFAMRSGLLRSPRVLLIGTDCPALQVDHLLSIAKGMQNRRLELIAAEDGGYVLIGGKSYHHRVFRGVDWGTACVLQQTVQQVRRINWQVCIHDVLWDIDEPQDLARAYKTKLICDERIDAQLIL